MPKVSWSNPLWDPIPRAVQRRMQAEAQARLYNHPRWSWARRGAGRALVAAYLLTLAGLATVGWIDAPQGGQREGLTGVLWLAFFAAILVEQALLPGARGAGAAQPAALSSPASPAPQPAGPGRGAGGAVNARTCHCW